MPCSWPTHLAWVKQPADDAQFHLARDDADDITGAYQWPAGAALAGELAQLYNCRVKRVLDLGCGRGALGFTALSHDAEHVVFADASPIAVDLVQRTIAANELTDRATVVQLSWGDAPPLGPYDLILGGDILYRPGLFPALARTIAQGLSPSGTCLLSDPRTTVESDLPAIFFAAGLTWESKRQGAYTLFRCEHR
jgi:predicted nicotinamide N-methyase